MRINSFLFSAAIMTAVFFPCACSTLGFAGIPSGKGWSSVPFTKTGTAEAGNIRVDKNADWDSVEAETRRLLPLLLAGRGYEAGAGGYRIDAVLIEREYMEGWKTRRSLSAEIRICGTGGETLLSAGKALLSGTKSLSSSKALHDLLDCALSRALQALEKR